MWYWGGGVHSDRDGGRHRRRLSPRGRGAVWLCSTDCARRWDANRSTPVLLKAHPSELGCLLSPIGDLGGGIRFV